MNQMKRELIICTIVLTTLMLSGCTRKTAEGAEQSSAAGSTTPSTSTDTVVPSASADTTHTTTQSSESTAQTQTGTAHSGDDATAMISEEEAKQIALAHAGLTADQVTFIKSGTDREDGHVRYDVEFYTNDKKEYDYEIDPYTGEILEYDYDAEYYVQSSDTTNTRTITEDEAKKIALDKVPGATSEHIREFKTDYDNGKLKYEGKIYYNQKEYEFEIDAHSSTILEWDEEPIYGANF